MKKIYAVRFLNLKGTRMSDVGLICEEYLQELEAKNYKKHRPDFGGTAQRIRNP